jgi:exosome complex RNA-binding protein Rrp4
MNRLVGFDFCISVNGLLWVKPDSEMSSDIIMNDG